MIYQNKKLFDITSVVNIKGNIQIIANNMCHIICEIGEEIQRLSLKSLSAKY